MFSAPCGSGEGAGEWRVSGGIWGMGGVTTHMHAYVHAHPHACKCMYRNCKWLPTWRHPCLSCLSCLTCMCMCACMCVHVCACMCASDTLLYTHAHPHPYPPICHPPGGKTGIGKNVITLELIKIFQFHLKI